MNEEVDAAYRRGVVDGRKMQAEEDARIAEAMRRMFARSESGYLIASDIAAKIRATASRIEKWRYQMHIMNIKEPTKPLRIAALLLPFKVDKKLVDAEGFVHGYLDVSESDPRAYFFVGGKPLFACTRPILLSQTHLMMRYLAAVFRGDERDPKKAKLCELVFFFNVPDEK